MYDKNHYNKKKKKKERKAKILQIESRIVVARNRGFWRDVDQKVQASS